MVTHGNLSVNSHAIMFDGLQLDAGRSRRELAAALPRHGAHRLRDRAALRARAGHVPADDGLRAPALALARGDPPLPRHHHLRAELRVRARDARGHRERRPKSWDLSCMRALGCGAEPIQADVLRAFVDALRAARASRPRASCPRTAWPRRRSPSPSPTSTAPLAHRPRRRRGDARRRTAEPASGRRRDGARLAAAARSPATRSRSSAPSGARLGERQVGEIWLRGPSVTAGYFGDAEATEEAFGGGWLRTGDLGYLRRRRRSTSAAARKDLIILNGKNYYPQDIERVVSRVDGHARRPVRRVLAPRRRAAPRSRSSSPSARKDAAGARRRRSSRAVRAELGLDDRARSHFIKRGTLPKTSSGKVRRRECEAPPRARRARARVETTPTRRLGAAATMRRRDSAAPRPEPPAHSRIAAASSHARSQSMGSSKAEVEVSYDVSNEFFRLWLDERMNYTCAVYEYAGSVARGRAAQQARDPLATSRKVTPEQDGARHRLRLGRVPRVPRHRAQGEARRRRHALQRAGRRGQSRASSPASSASAADFMKCETEEKFDALISICMIDHLVLAGGGARRARPSTSTASTSRSAGSWTNPGAWFGLQTILRNRTPKMRPGARSPTHEGPRGLYFCTHVIFPGGLNPRLEEIIQAVNPYWEVVEMHTRREDYQRTTARVAAAPAPQREDDPREVGRQGLRRLRPLPRHLRPRLRHALQLARAVRAPHGSIELMTMSQKHDLARDVQDRRRRASTSASSRTSPRESVITELGIDSLSMMQIVGEMETELGIMIPDEDLVELVTVGDLCRQGARRGWRSACMETRLEERLYQEYMTFFEKAERERRWNVFDDIPWDAASTRTRPKSSALCAETFCCVEMYLPDYVAGGINVVRKYFGQAWFQANWAYEESKHSLALMQYLLALGQAHRGADVRLCRTASSTKKWELPVRHAAADDVLRLRPGDGDVRHLREAPRARGRRERRVPAHHLRLRRARRDRALPLLPGRDQGAARRGPRGHARRHGARVRQLRDAGRRPRARLRLAHPEDARGRDRSQRVHPEGVHADPEVPRRQPPRDAAPRSARPSTPAPTREPPRLAAPALDAPPARSTSPRSKAPRMRRRVAVTGLGVVSPRRERRRRRSGRACSPGDRASAFITEFPTEKLRSDIAALGDGLRHRARTCRPRRPTSTGGSPTSASAPRSRPWRTPGSTGSRRTDDGAGARRRRRSIARASAA